MGDGHEDNRRSSSGFSAFFRGLTGAAERDALLEELDHERARHNEIVERLEAERHEALQRLEALEQTLRGSTAALDEAREAQSRSDETIAELRERIEELEAAPPPPTDEALEDALREQEALVEELELAVQAQRQSIEQRDRKLAEQTAEIETLRGVAGSRSGS